MKLLVLTVLCLIALASCVPDAHDEEAKPASTQNEELLQDAPEVDETPKEMTEDIPTEVEDDDENVEDGDDRRRYLGLRCQLAQCERRRAYYQRQFAQCKRRQARYQRQVKQHKLRLVQCSRRLAIALRRKGNLLQKHFRLCEGQTNSLRCPKGKIKVLESYYGRTSKNHCIRAGLMKNTDCISAISRNKIRSACEGKRECKLEAKNSVYGDPCIGTYKYVEVLYNCVV
ncbi:uncharacterized protein LOC116614342 isoform X2 [Nematostella vectensis]|uniref:uncharacterized protein LOC116614342 isoform X2 n=1 Tax=Nematostella vectensis TaxID=45351 RepID=UPI0020771987|nr:uncharacterized protein LOC116614342 isoform X2 [Nematostella vectensis]